MNFNDILYLLGFFLLVGVPAVAFYVYGQFLDRHGNQKNHRLLVNSLASHKRLTEEVKHEALEHRRIADDCRTELDKKEEHWVSVEKRWEEKAEKAKQMIAYQDELRTKHAVSLKESNRKLMSIEDEYQKTKAESLAQINALKLNQEQPEKLKALELKAAEVNKQYSAELEHRRTQIVGLQENLTKHDEKQKKLESIILKKNSDINGLKMQIQQSGQLDSKIAAANAALIEKDKRYEAAKLDLKTRNDSLAELVGKLEESRLKVGELEGQAIQIDELDEIKKTMFIKETQLVEKESAMKKLAQDLDQKQHQVALLQTDINARNQKLTSLVSQMEDTSELDEAMKKIASLTNDVQGRDERITSLLERLEGVEMVFEAQKKHVSEVKEQGALKESTIEKLNDCLVEKNAELAALQARTKVLEAQFVDSSERDRLTERVSLLRSQITEKDSIISRAHEAIASEKSKVNQLVEESKKPVLEVAKLKEDLSDMELQLQDSSEVERLNKQLDALRATNDHQQIKIAEHHTVLKSNKDQLEERDCQIQKIQTELTAIVEEKSQLTGKAELMERRLLEIHLEAETLRKDLSDTSKQERIDFLLTENKGKHKRLIELEKATIQQSEELVQLQQALEDSSETERLKEEVSQKDLTLNSIRQEAELAEMKAKELEKQRNAHLVEISGLRAEVNRVSQKVADTTDVDDLKNQLDHKIEFISTLNTQVSERENKITGLENTNTLSELQSKYAGKDQEVELLRAQLREYTKQSMLASFGAGAEEDAERGIIYGSEPKEKDNLGEVFGVSEDLQNQLNNLGVYQHKQLAFWTDPQIEFFQKELNFDGNINREQWVIQSQRLVD